MPFTPSELEHPIVQGPMAGGPSTPRLAAEVSAAGGLGFLAAGYRSVEAVRDDIAAVRRATGRPFGVNVMASPAAVADPAIVQRYASSLAGEASRYRAQLGEPSHDDDRFEKKVALLVDARVAVVSFTFGCPSTDVVERLREAGCAVWVTVTTPAEALVAARVGANALIAQGVEAGGHRGSFDDAAPGDLGVLALLQLVREAVDLPLVAAGGIVTGLGVAGALAAGAAAAQLGTAFMLTSEAATVSSYRAVLAAGETPTALTRAFTGRMARGVANRFMAEHGADAPSAYPEVHHLTSPIRAAARERGDADGFNLWAGQAYPLAREAPAGQLVRELAEEARTALREAVARAG